MILSRESIETEVCDHETRIDCMLDDYVATIDAHKPANSVSPMLLLSRLNRYLSVRA